MINDKDYISHHGVLGQKWGEQNGPPYPLNEIKKGINSLKNKVNVFINNYKQKRLNDIKSSYDINVIYKNLDKFTTQELFEKKNRLELERSLKLYLPPKKVTLFNRFMDRYTGLMTEKVSNLMANKTYDIIFGDNSKPYAKESDEDFIKNIKNKTTKEIHERAALVKSIGKINNATKGQYDKPENNNYDSFFRNEDLN